MIESMKSRRSIRRYQKRDIDNVLLNNLLSVASRASTMGNMQLYSVVVTRDEAGKELLSPPF